MKPTLLHFRSPKESTPEPILPKVTYDGRSLSYKQKKDKRTRFFTDKRFKIYDIEAKRTGKKIGPGSYSPVALRTGINAVRGSPVYKNFYAAKDSHKKEYFYVGNHLIEKIQAKATRSSYRSRKGLSSISSTEFSSVKRNSPIVHNPGPETGFRKRNRHVSNSYDLKQYLN